MEVVIHLQVLNQVEQVTHRQYLLLKEIMVELDPLTQDIELEEAVVVLELLEEILVLLLEAMVEMEQQTILQDQIQHTLAVVGDQMLTMALSVVLDLSLIHI